MICLDSAAVVKLVHAEPESAALRGWLDERAETGWVSSVLVEIESFRTLARYAPGAVARLPAVLDQIDLIDLDPRRLGPGGELQVHGSGALTRWLLENDLVGEMTLIVIPVILGQGARLFPEAGPDRALDLIESRVDSTGVTTQVYRLAGRPQYAPAKAPARAG
jgi:hypothetical protein